MVQSSTIEQAVSRTTTSASRGRLLCITFALALLGAGCTSVPLTEGGTLASYNKLGEAKGRLSKKRLYVDSEYIARVKTVKIIPTTYSYSASSSVKSEADRVLVSNSLNRALCVALSDRYQMVPADGMADLTVRSVITNVVPTNKTMAGVATAVTLGAGAVLPVVPRLPFGLGGVAVEAEAIDNAGAQRAAMLWSRGANSIQNSPRVSEVGDAYDLASEFAGDFSQLLVAGKEEEGFDLSLPSRQKTKSWLGGKPKYAACEAFGRAPGLMGAVASNFGAPPEWTDKRAKPISER